MMLKKNKKSKNKKYKFFAANLWGALFLTKRFRGRDVLLARMNRRMVTKVLDVNPVKLRKKRLSIEGQGLRAKYMLKRFYFNYREYQLRKVYSKIINKKRKPVRKIPELNYTENLLVKNLENRVSSLLYRSGLFISPHQVRFAINHSMVLVNGELCHHPLRLLQIGDVISFRDVNLKRRLAYFFMRRLVQFQSYNKDQGGSLKPTFRRHKGKPNNRNFKGNFKNQKFAQQSRPQKKHTELRKPRNENYKHKHHQKGVGNKPRLNSVAKAARKYNPFVGVVKRSFSSRKKVKKVKKSILKTLLSKRSIIVRKRINAQRCKKMSPILLTHLGGLRQYNLIFLPKLLAIQVVDKAYLLKHVYYPNALDFEVLKVHFKSLS